MSSRSLRWRSTRDEAVDPVLALVAGGVSTVIAAIAGLGTALVWGVVTIFQDYTFGGFVHAWTSPILWGVSAAAFIGTAMILGLMAGMNPWKALVTGDLHTLLERKVDPALKAMRSRVLSPELSGDATARGLLEESIAQRKVLVESSNELRKVKLKPADHPEQAITVQDAVEAILAASKLVEEMHTEAVKMRKAASLLTLRSQGMVPDQTRRLHEMTLEAKGSLAHQRAARVELEDQTS